MGCLHKVFATEIDVELFEEAERTRAGFGVVKLAGAPRERCAFSIERAYPRRATTASTAASSTGRRPRPAPCAPSTCATGSDARPLS